MSTRLRHLIMDVAADVPSPISWMFVIGLAVPIMLATNCAGAVQSSSQPLQHPIGLDASKKVETSGNDTREEVTPGGCRYVEGNHTVACRADCLEIRLQPDGFAVPRWTSEDIEQLAQSFPKLRFKVIPRLVNEANEAVFDVTNQLRAVAVAELQRLGVTSSRIVHADPERVDTTCGRKLRSGSDTNASLYQADASVWGSRWAEAPIPCVVPIGDTALPSRRLADVETPMERSGQAAQECPSGYGACHVALTHLASRGCSDTPLLDAVHLGFSRAIVECCTQTKYVTTARHRLQITVDYSGSTAVPTVVFRDGELNSRPFQACLLEKLRMLHLADPFTSTKAHFEAVVETVSAGPG